MRIFAWTPALALALAACGGKVFLDSDPGSGGNGGAGGVPSSSSTSSGSSASSTSSSASSSSSSSSSGGPVCPDVFPGIYTPCGVEGAECTAPFACCGGAVTCKNGLWVTSAPPCDGCLISCGPEGFGCVAGAICVVHFAAITTYNCEKNPCPGPPVCSCAEPLCAAQSMGCNNTSGNEVYCD